MNAIEASNALLEALALYARPFTFSMDFGERPADLRVIIEHGRTVGVVLAPARKLLKLAFTRPDGMRVSLAVEEASNEAIVVTAVATVAALMPLASENPQQG